MSAHVVLFTGPWEYVPVKPFQITDCIFDRDVVMWNCTSSTGDGGDCQTMGELNGEAVLRGKMVHGCGK